MRRVYKYPTSRGASGSPGSIRSNLSASHQSSKLHSAFPTPPSSKPLFLTPPYTPTTPLSSIVILGLIPQRFVFCFSNAFFLGTPNLFDIFQISIYKHDDYVGQRFARHLDNIDLHDIYLHCLSNCIGELNVNVMQFWKCESTNSFRSCGSEQLQLNYINSIL